MGRIDTISIKIASGARQGESFRFEGETKVSIGSDPQSDIRVADDPAIQPKHVQLDIKPPGCRLRVAEGKPLVRVNGRMATQAKLQEGDKFTVGGTVFEIVASSAESAITTEEHFAPTIISSDEPACVPIAESVAPVAAPPGYDVIRRIGQGAMGIVFEAFHKATRSRMAIKILHPSGPASDRAMQLFLREASLLSQLNHPRIVQFHELGWVEGRVFLAMEYVDAIDFAELLAKRAPERRVKIATGILCQILDALHYAHGHRVVHRDVKPSNILVARDGNTLRARLSDFGLAKNFENAGMSGMTEEGETRGTLAFMAPEQFRDSRHAKPSADIYSVGVSLFYLLSGRYPFPKVNTVLERLKSLDEPPLALDSCFEDAPAGLSDVLMQSMQIDPAERFKTAIDLRNALLPYSRSS